MDVKLKAYFSAGLQVVDLSACTLNINLCNENLQHSESSAAVELVPDSAFFAALAQSEGFPAVLVDDQGTVLFTGEVSVDASWRDVGEPYPIHRISLTVKDRTSRLAKKTQAEIAMVNTSLGAVVSRLASDCGLELADSPPHIHIPYFVVQKDRAYLSLLDTLCFQYRKVFYFDKGGKIRLFDFTDIPAAMPVLTDGDIANALDVKKSLKKYTAIKIKYNTLSAKDNELVYRASQNHNSQGHPEPFIIPPGGYYPFESSPIVEAVDGKARQTFESGFAETVKKHSGELSYRRSKNTTLLYSSNHAIEQDWEGQLSVDRTEYTSMGAAARLRNTGSGDARLKQFSIRASAVYRNAEAEVAAGNQVDGEVYTTDAEFVYTGDNASMLAGSLYRYFSKGNYALTIPLENQAVQPGSFRRIDAGASGFAVNALVIGYTHDAETDIYTHKALSVGDATAGVVKGTSYPSDDRPRDGLDGKDGTSWSDIFPDDVQALAATAVQDGVRLVITAASGLQFEIQRSTDHGQTWPQSKITSEKEFLWQFNRAINEWPEIDSFNPWRFRVRARNVEKASPNWKVSPVDTSSYGTWLPPIPMNGTGMSAAREVKAMVDKPPSNLYGFAGYDIQISKDGSSWFSPASGKDVYASEDNWRENSTGGGYRRMAANQWTQSVPLTGQDVGSPVNTAYFFRFRAVTDRPWGESLSAQEYQPSGGFTASAWTGSISVLATATGASDIVDRAMTTQKIAANALNSPTQGLQAYYSFDDVTDMPTDKSELIYYRDRFTQADAGNGHGNWTWSGTVGDYWGASNQAELTPTIGTEGELVYTINLPLLEIRFGRRVDLTPEQSNKTIRLKVWVSDPLIKMMSITTYKSASAFENCGWKNINSGSWCTIEGRFTKGIPAKILFNFRRSDDTKPIPPFTVKIASAAYGDMAYTRIADMSGNANHGTAGGVMPVRGVSGRGLVGSGNITHAAQRLKAVCFWLRQGTTTRAEFIDNATPWINSSTGVITYKHSGGNSSLTASFLNDGNIHFYSIVFASSEVFFFRDGVPILRQPHTYTGVYADSSKVDLYSSFIDELRFYDRPLTDSEVLYLYQNPAGGMPGTVVAERVITPSLTAISGNLAVLSGGVEDENNYWCLDSYPNIPPDRSVGEFRAGGRAAHAGRYFKVKPDATGRAVGAQGAGDEGDPIVRMESGDHYLRLTNKGIEMSNALLEYIAAKKALIDALIVKSLKIDPNPASTLDFEAIFNEIQGLDIRSLGKEILKIEPSGKAKFIVRDGEISIINNGWKLSLQSCQDGVELVIMGGDGGDMKKKQLWTSIKGGVMSLFVLGSISCDNVYKRNTAIIQTPIIGIDMNIPVDKIACNGNTWVVVGNGGAIVVSQDNGNTWQVKTYGTTQHLSGITCNGNTWVAAGGGAIVVSQDNGNTWQVKTSGTSYYLHSIACNGNTWVVVGTNGAIVVSQDNGNTWQVKPSGTTHNAVKMLYGNGLYAIIYGYDGTIIVSQDNGNTWQKKQPRSANFNDLGFNGNTWVITCFPNAILTSKDLSVWQ